MGDVFGVQRIEAGSGLIAHVARKWSPGEPGYAMWRILAEAASEDDDDDDAEGAKRFDPDQPRDRAGRWTDGSSWPFGDGDVRTFRAGAPAITGWEEALTDGEASALRDYTAGGYRDINQALRAGGGDPRADQIRSAIRKAGEYDDPPVVYRGLMLGPGKASGPSVGIPQDERNKADRAAVAEWAASTFKPGSEIILGGFQSTSFDPNPALDASVGRDTVGVVFEIRARRGAYLHGLSGFDDEYELLLPDDSRFRVVGVLDDVEFERDFDVTSRRTVIKLEQL